MEAALKPKRDISDAIAMPRAFQKDGKWNEPRVHTQYPRMPLVPSKTKGRAPEPYFLDRDKLNPLIFQNAREEAEFMKAEPEVGALIAEVDATRSPVGTAMDEVKSANRALAETNETLKAERNSLEAANANLADELEAAKAELAAALAMRNGQPLPGSAAAEDAANEAGEPLAPRRGRPPGSTKAVVQGRDVG